MMMVDSYQILTKSLVKTQMQMMSNMMDSWSERLDCL